MKVLSVLWFMLLSVFTSTANAQTLTAGQIRQIEDIAKNIAILSNKNNAVPPDDMTVSFHAVAIGRNVRFENVLRVKKKNDLPPNKIKQWLEAMRMDILPKSCMTNANNPAFDRGLSYTFVYHNTYGEKLGEIFVDKDTCDRLGL